LVSYRWKPKWKSPFSRLQYNDTKEDTIELLMYDVNWGVTLRSIKIDNPDFPNLLAEVISILKPKLSTDLGLIEKEKIEVNAQQKKGWLTKAGARPTNSWKKRWFILDNGVVKYYKSGQTREPEGSFEVNGNRIVQVEVQKKKYVFSVVTKERTFHIQAESEHEKQGWISAFIQHGGIVSD